MAMIDVVTVPMVCVLSILVVTFLHGLAEELATALPGALGTDFQQVIDIGFPLIERLSIFLFFFYYVVSAIKAWRTRSGSEFIGVQIVYGILSLFLVPIIVDIYNEFIASSTIFSSGATFYTAFTNNITTISLFFLGVIFVLLNYGRKSYGYTA